MKTTDFSYKHLLSVAINSNLYHPLDDFCFSLFEKMEQQLVFEFSSDIYNRLYSTEFLAQKLIDAGHKEIMFTSANEVFARLNKLDDLNKRMSGIDGYRDLTEPLFSCQEVFKTLYDKS